MQEERFSDYNELIVAMAAPEMNSMSLFLGRYFLPFGVIKGKRDELSCAVLFVSMNPVLFLALCAAVCEATAPRTTFVGSFLFTDLAWGFTIFGALPRLWPFDYVLNAVSPFRPRPVRRVKNRKADQKIEHRHTNLT